MKAVTCYRCFLFFYVILNCIAGLAVGVLASYLLLTRQEWLPFKPKRVLLYFLIVPPLFIFFSTALGWSSIRKEKVKLIKLFSALLAISAILKLIGCLWWFSILPQMNNQVLLQLKKMFTVETFDSSQQNWWDNIQTKLKCCGVLGFMDYHTKKSVPFSCCGFDSNDANRHCSFFWQTGCSTSLAQLLSQDINLLCVLLLIVAFLQIPAVFTFWWFANKIKCSQTKSNIKSPSIPEQVSFVFKSAN